MKRSAWVVAGILIIFAVLCLMPERFQVAVQMVVSRLAKATIADRVEQYGDAVRMRWKPYFEKAGVQYPPHEIVFIALKQEKQLEVWVADNNNVFKHIRTYPILGASGTIGPKLLEGDRQVPEGIYEIDALNPNSSYHLSLRINYPNDLDRMIAEQDDRTNLGGNIFIHGSTLSIGCLAMGDEAAEDLFILAAETGIDKIRVILAPLDLRIHPLPDELRANGRRGTRYESIQMELDMLSR